MTKEHEVLDTTSEAVISSEVVNAITDKVEIDTKKVEEIKDEKSKVDELLNKNSNLKEWFNKYSSNWINTIGKSNTYEIFLSEKFSSMHENEIKNLTESDFKAMYEEWNKARLEKLRKWLTLSNLEKFSLHYQKLFLWNWTDEDNKKYLKKLDAAFKDKDSYEGAIDLFYDYSLKEIVWELILKEDFRILEKWAKSDDLKKIQLLAGLFVQEDKPFEISVDGLWWPQTWTFFDMLLQDQDFLNSTNWKVYEEKIRRILQWRKDFKGRHTNLYRSMSDTSRRMEEYINNPIKYWKEQSVLSRHFVWVEASKTPYPSIDEMSDADKDFISWNRSQALDSNLSELFDVRWKSRDQAREIMQRLRSLMPKDELKQYLADFLKNEKVRKEFSEFFKKPASVLDDPILVDTIISDRWWQEWTQDIRKWITSWMWASVWSWIISLSIDLQSYIRRQCGLSALSVRWKFLESVFWEWTSFEPVDREVKIDPSAPEYPVYFRDKNNPSTIYEYRPNTWDIMAEKYYSKAGWKLSFWKWRLGEAPMQIHTMKAKFSDFMQNISVADLLPKERVESRSDLKDVIWRNIENRMNYTVPVEEWDTMRKKNSLMHLKNGTVDSALKMIGLLDSNNGGWISLSEEENGPYYYFMKRLIDNVEGASENELKALNTFMSNLSDKVMHADTLDVKSINNPLMRFIVSEQRWLKSYWEDRVRARSKEVEWKKKDLLLWTVLESIFDGDKVNYDKLGILNSWVFDTKFMNLASSIESRYNEVAKENEIAVTSQLIGWELQALRQDVAIWEEFSSRIEAAY